MLDTAEVIDIWSCPPKAPNLVGKTEAEGGYPTAREIGLSVITEEQDNGSFGQVRYYFRIIQITANMLSGGKSPSLEGGCNFGSQASQSEPSLGNKLGHQAGQYHFWSQARCGYKIVRWIFLCGPD